MHTSMAPIGKRHDRHDSHAGAARVVDETSQVASAFVVKLDAALATAVTDRNLAANHLHQVFVVSAIRRHIPSYVLSNILE